MKMLGAAAFAATALGAGFVAGALPAQAASCGCPPVQSHTHHHHVVRHRSAYREPYAYAPPAEDEVVYDAPPVYYPAPVYAGPAWYTPYGYGGWGYPGWGRWYGGHWGGRHWR